jgi:hypothetical protein
MFVGPARSLFGGSCIQESACVVDLTSTRGRIHPFSVTFHTAGICSLIKVLQHYVGVEFYCEIPILNFNKKYQKMKKTFLLPKSMFVVHVNDGSYCPL